LSQILNLLNLDPVDISNQFDFLVHLPLDYHLVPRQIALVLLMLALLAIWLIFHTGLGITPKNHCQSILFLTRRAFSCIRFLSETRHALLVPFLVVLPNDFLDAVSCPEDVDNSTVYIFFLIDFTPERGVIPPIRQRYPLRSRGSRLHFEF
jgi:hypothetical protein